MYILSFFVLFKCAETTRPLIHKYGDEYDVNMSYRYFNNTTPTQIYCVTVFLFFVGCPSRKCCVSYGSKKNVIFSRPHIAGL